MTAAGPSCRCPAPGIADDVTGRRARGSGHGRGAGQVAIITGGASGQGAAEARLFVHEGAKVIIGDVQDGAGRVLADELGKSARFVYLDVASAEDWTDVISCTTETFGDATILVQSAAIVHHRLIEDSTAEQFERVRSWR